MSTLYDNDKVSKYLSGEETTPPKDTPLMSPKPNQEEIARPVAPMPEEMVPAQGNEPNEISYYRERANDAMSLVEDIVLKQYVSRLSDLTILTPEESFSTKDVVLFKVNKMVYEKDEYATDKFISVVSAMTYTKCSVFLVIDGQKDKTDFYLGVKNNDDDRNSSSVAEAFRNSIIGQFPGISIEDLSMVKAGDVASKQDRILSKITDCCSISSYVGIPAYKNSKGEYTNQNFIQGVEKFATAMKGKVYTAIILASNVQPQELSVIRNSYEGIYTELSTMATQQLAYSTNESLANAVSRTKGYSEGKSVTDTIGESESSTEGKTLTEGESHTKTSTKGESSDNFWGKASKLAEPLIEAGAILTATGVAAPLGAILMGAGAIGGIGGVVGAKQKSKSESIADGTNKSTAISNSVTKGTNTSHAEGTTQTESFNETDGTTSTVGSGKNFTLTVQNKHVQEVLKRIDKQLERIEMCEGTGVWSSGAYFISYDQDRANAEIGASIFRSIMQGEHSGVETSAINTWYKENDSFGPLTKYVGSVSHPSFAYFSPAFGASINVLPSALISSKELAMMIGLPRKSVPGLPVVEHTSFGKEVVRLSQKKGSKSFSLGCIYDQGVTYPDTPVRLDAKSLCQHTFVTGSTGCGKSNTIYYLLNQVRNQPDAPKFLIIEPAKGEYKDVFGNEHVYGTNPLKTRLLRINPFRFPEGVHVLEHIDRLIEIFNVCWPMYAAMPAVLKESMLNAYEDCGWDLYSSTNKHSPKLFPNFTDLQNELVLTIEGSAYSEEVKSNYAGSLVTRVKSLCNGINKQIFSTNELGDYRLFDENVIVDLSRIGSQETKALIMGILIMRLNEYRSNSGIEHNSDLRHITVLEEAHNILKKCSQEQTTEGSNVAGKSVEMISNAIAEMRTYGEGFIIVDQSPGAVDISAIRNTNTKILMRLPEDSDRKIAGKAAAMKDNQIDEIAKLPTGVAVVYQNDWEEPVLCNIHEYTETAIPYTIQKEDSLFDEQQVRDVENEIIKFLLFGRVDYSGKVDFDLIHEGLTSMPLSTSAKWMLFENLEEYKKTGTIVLWRDGNFNQLSVLMSEILSLREKVQGISNTVTSFALLDDNLKELAHDRCPLLPEEFISELTHCMMSDYANGGDARKRIYNAWVSYIKNRGNEN
mgnify:CR=1 FL=1